MKKRMALVMALVMTLIAPAAAFALEADWGTKRGDWEMNLVGNSDSYSFKDGGGKFSNTRIQGTLGYFLTDGIEVGGALYLSASTSDFSDGKSTSTTTSPRIFAAYHINMQGNLTPFAGLYIETLSGKDDNPASTFTWDETAFGLMGGAKYFVSEWAAITGQIEFDSRKMNFGDSGSDTASRFGFMFGLSLYF
ncbi:MAG: porin family protein [Nitrospinota bacterium]|nr:porin family protein [Nitrospinota bacterium]